MTKTEQEKLKPYISILKDWRGNRLPHEVVSVFNGLEDLNQDKNVDLTRLFWKLMNLAGTHFWIISNRTREISSGGKAYLLIGKKATDHT